MSAPISDYTSRAYDAEDRLKEMDLDVPVRTIVYTEGAGPMVSIDLRVLEALIAKGASA